ncbi:MAG: hypothetical protein WBE34_01820 [Candidatus Nitrosopolaris sp.]
MLLETTETVLEYFGLDRTIYDAESVRKTNRKWGGMNLQKNGLDIERENMKRSLFKALRRILVPLGKFYARQGC